ncbi:hypothetical protein [Desulfobotulus mexicanus]|uniref:Uncharacterized protein n=1 Tax=Desulfobotulus mexicanus TaxID=2586642 RepID=A0A5S5MEM0_9BACT|nr:hypothetical protein [Desulfobotulus mexicanus]TYT74173.1 hypothetical protein FIM25_11350 [Desulfobotulus mexicanus]
MTVYSYGISGMGDLVFPSDPMYSHPLPADTDKDTDIQCGAFLKGVGIFLDENINEVEKIYSEKIEKIHIILEKHGAFYHPCKVVINGRNSQPMVVNGAVSAEAIRTMGKEIKALGKLKNKSARDIPEVYFSGEYLLESGKAASFFSAPWFEGFCEFHWSCLEDGSLGIKVWEDDGSRSVMQEKEVSDFFRKAAAILSRSYDFDTFDQIFPWHHAAGDFVVCRDLEKVDVRLITVRQYTSLLSMDSEETDLSDKLECLFHFLWNMLMRMRLDRLDGVGELVWAPDYVIAPCIAGFFEGLSEKAPDSKEMLMIIEAIPEIVRSMGSDHLFSLHEEIMSACNPMASDIVLIKKHMRAHSDSVFEVICDCSKNM